MLLAEFKRPVAAEKTKVEIKSNRCSARGGVALGRLNGNRVRRISFHPKAKQSDAIKCDCPDNRPRPCPDERQPR
jgi:hypothetical protein